MKGNGKKQLPKVAALFDNSLKCESLQWCHKIKTDREITLTKPHPSYLNNHLQGFCPQLSEFFTAQSHAQRGKRFQRKKKAVAPNLHSKCNADLGQGCVWESSLLKTWIFCDSWHLGFYKRWLTSMPLVESYVQWQIETRFQDTECSMHDQESTWTL